MDYLNDPFAILPVDTTPPPEHRSTNVTFTYTPWTPPAKEAGAQAGAQKKASIHEGAINENLGTDTWTEFVVQPANTDPADPYNGDLQQHGRDLGRGARALDANVTYQFYNGATGERWMNIKTEQYMTDGAPAVIRFKARRKKLV